MSPTAEFDFSPWPVIASARATTDTKIQELLQAFTQRALEPSSDLSFVVFGSLARREWTSHGDIDWLLLVDGQADPKHALFPRLYQQCLVDLGFTGPGPTGTFGNLDFSHGLIHQIGGEQDTNANITRRVSLLLESRPVGRPDAHQRILRGIIDCYVDDMLVTTHLKDLKPRVPRFLLNDIVRFWRTMAVDYASKKRGRSAESWALRNFKLRMSRKLIFAAGLLTSFQCRIALAGPYKDIEDLRSKTIEYLYDSAHRTPLEIVAQSTKENSNETVLKSLLDSYSEFLAIVADRTTRNELKNLPLDEAADSTTWKEVNRICEQFQAALEELFFGSSTLAPLSRRYGVF